MRVLSLFSCMNLQHLQFFANFVIHTTFLCLCSDETGKLTTFYISRVRQRLHNILACSETTIVVVAIGSVRMPQAKLTYTYSSLFQTYREVQSRQSSLPA